jgi:O-antigen/teichoic acid export membrane protein
MVYYSEIIRKGFPFFLGVSSLVLAISLDKALVVMLLPMVAVGLYAVAFTFGAAYSSIGAAVGLTSFATLANEPDAAQQGQLIARIFRQSSLVYLGAG